MGFEFVNKFPDKPMYGKRKLEKLTAQLIINNPITTVKIDGRFLRYCELDKTTQKVIAKQYYRNEE